jgi:hypothetical protein
MLQGAEIVNENRGPKSISAQYQRPQQRKGRPGANVEWKRIKQMSRQMSIEGAVNEAVKISREAASVIGRWMLFGHLKPLQAEAARRYAYIMARFDKYHTEGRRTAKSPSYERAFGTDQELERRAFNGTLDAYEKSARKARRHYDKLITILDVYRDPITLRNPLKEALDQMCCEDIEPPAQYRDQIAAALTHIAHEFGVTIDNRRGRPRKNGRR